MRRLATIITLLIVVGGVCQWGSQMYQNTWEPYLRMQLEKTASTAIHRTVQIETIALSFWGRIRLLHVQVWEGKPGSPLLFEAPEIALNISLIDLPRAIAHRNPVEAIGIVSVKTPVLRLSTETLPKSLGSSSSQKSNLPIWFTLAWEDGTFQWKSTQVAGPQFGSRMPERWTIYGSQGLFRIRGPQMNFAMKGHVDPAESFRLQFSTLGRRWNAQAYLFEGSIDKTRALLETILKQPLLPHPMNAHGHYTLEARAMGKRWPIRGDTIWTFLQDMRLTLKNTQLQIKPTLPAILIDGQILMSDRKLSFSDTTLRFGKDTLNVTGYAGPIGPRAELAIDAQSKHATLDALSTLAGWQDSLHGETDIAIAVRGTPSTPEITLKTTTPQGDVYGWPFKDASLHMRYLHEHWEFLDNSVQLLDGRASFKGYVASADNDVTITLNDLSLHALNRLPSWTPPEGRLNASVTLRGPAENWRLASAWWVTGFQWGPAGNIQSVRGDLEITPHRFQTQAVSDNGLFHFNGEGRRTEQDIRMDRLEIRLPSGASATGDGKISLVDKELQGSISAEKMAFPSDFPYLTLRRPVQGTLKGDARLSGTLGAPVLQGTFSSEDLRVGGQRVGTTDADWMWDKSQLLVRSLRMSPGVEASWRRTNTSHEWTLEVRLKDAPAGVIGLWNPTITPNKGAVSGHIEMENGTHLRGSGSLILNDAAYGSWTIQKGSVEFAAQGSKLEVKKLDIESNYTAASLKGHFRWIEAGKSGVPPEVVFEGQGTVRSPESDPLWEFPVQFSGRSLETANGAEGRMKLKTARPLLGHKPADPLEATFQWDANTLAWSDVTWGNQWTSKGNLHWENGEATWSARLEADDLHVREWQRILNPRPQDMIDGKLHGSFALSGPLKHPIATFRGQWTEARWRGFQFKSYVEGRWSDGDLKPLTVNGTLDQGGRFAFQGSMTTPEHLLQGSLKLDHFALKPLGESLSFPKTIQGNIDATFTVNGPLASLRLAGHLDGSPVVYATESDHPFRLENLTMDMTVAPSPEQSNSMRLTISEAQAKTLEEQIRIHNGSYIEFVGNKAAPLKIGADIRNLHLGVFTLFGGLDLQGAWEIKPQGFSIQGQARTRSLFINDYELEEGVVLADYYNGVLRFQPPPLAPALITGTIDFQNAPQLKFSDFAITGKDAQTLQVTGDVGPKLWNFGMIGRRLDMGTLAGLASFPYSMNGTADLSIHGKGDATHPHIEGTINLDNGSALGLAFRTGTASFVWQNDQITFTKLALSDSGRYTLVGAGVVPRMSKKKTEASEELPIDFTVRLQDSNLQMLRSISSEIKAARGAVEGILQIRGTPSDPTLRGSLRVANGDIENAHYFRRLQNVVINIDFDDNKILVRDIHAKSGNGEFRVTGNIALAGFIPAQYELRADITSSRGIDVQIPELAIPESPLAKRFRFLTTASRGDLRGHIAFRGPAENPTFSGEGLISNGHFTFPPSQKNPPSPAVVEWFRRVFWDVNLRFQDGAWFENELVQAGINGNLKLLGPSDRLKVDGGIDIPEGRFSYLGLQFDIREGRYDVRSSEHDSTIVNTPYVRGIAETKVQTVDTINGLGGGAGNRLNIDDVITLTLDYAPVDQIKPRLSSAANPTLSQDKLLARATQTDVENLSPQERTYLYQKQIVSLIDSSLATPLAQNILKKAGIADRLRVQHVIDPSAATAPDTTAAGALATQQNSSVNLFANTKYTVEKDLSSRLSFGYGIRFIPTTTAAPDDAQQKKLDLVSDVQLSYRWFKNVYLRGAFDLPNSNPSILPDRRVTIEPRIRFGWWGNTNKPKPKPTPPTPKE